MNLKNIKALLFDLDGTLVNQGSYISDLTIESLRSLKKKGYKLFINSGRPVFLTLKLLNKYDLLPLFTMIFGCNGIEVYDVSKNKLDKSAALSSEVIKKIANIYKDEPIAITLLTENGLLINKMITLEVIEFYKKTRGLDYHLINFDELDFNSSKVLGVVDRVVCLENNLKVDLLNSEEFDCFYSNRNLIEFVPKGFNKAKACQYIKEHFGLSADEMLAFGDEENDIPMFEECIGVAMGNAYKTVANYAKYTTSSVEELGISSFLKENNVI